MQIARGFVYEGGKTRRILSVKPGTVADLARSELDAGHHVLIWTTYDAEGEAIASLLKDRSPSLLTGKTKPARRVKMIEAFRSGESPLLISKPSLLGLGLNLQCCTSMIFSGFDDSFERFYQAIRRAYRYGQTKPVRVHIPYIPELEGMVWENVQAKQVAFERDCAIMERCYIEAMRDMLPAHMKGNCCAQEAN
jgi:superfamily II DNA or RNA helicase